MNYSVIRAFFDLQDGEYGYHVGDVFPREGYAPSQERLDSLLSANNARHQPFIVEVEEVAEEVAEEVTEVPEKATKAPLLELLGE